MRRKTAAEYELPKLGKFVDEESFRPQWATFLTRQYPWIFYLPTEIDVSEPQFVIPTIARAYSTDLYLADPARPASHDELHEIYAGQGAQFPGTYAFEEVIMAEIWDDVGSDGHTCYRLDGWRFVGAKLFGEKMWEAARKPAPDFMLSHYDEEG